LKRVRTLFVLREPEFGRRARPAVAHVSLPPRIAVQIDRDFKLAV
jgi:hypothetical protein